VRKSDSELAKPPLMLSLFPDSSPCAVNLVSPYIVAMAAEDLLPPIKAGNANVLTPLEEILQVRKKY